MKHLVELENKIWGLGFFSGQVELKITLQSEFEGFYGRASEDWEKSVIIEIISPDHDVIKNVRVVGHRGEKIDDVAKKVLSML